MYFRQFLNDDTACASYLFGCKTVGEFAVVDAHIDLVDDYIAAAEAQGAKITAVIETHVQADHVSGLPQLVERTGATAYLPEGSGVEFEHQALADAEVLELGNTVIEAIATPGHAPAHHTYLVTDHRQDVDELARTLYRSLHERLMALPDHLLVYPAHYAGSVCGRGLSAHPASTIGFERRHNEALSAGSEDEFVEAVLKDIPPAPDQQAAIVAANRSGEPSAAPA